MLYFTIISVAIVLAATCLAFKYLNYKFTNMYSHVATLRELHNKSKELVEMNKKYESAPTDLRYQYFVSDSTYMAFVKEVFDKTNV